MTLTSSQAVNEYTTLEEMGVKNAQEISSYKLRTDGADKDVLKIRYKRAKGSLLPQSRTYQFGRSLNTVVADGGTSRLEHTYEISPVLLNAIAELDELVAGNKKIKTTVKSKLGKERVEELLHEFAELEALVSQDISKTSAATVSARFSRLKAQIAVL